MAVANPASKIGVVATSVLAKAICPPNDWSSSSR